MRSMDSPIRVVLTLLIVLVHSGRAESGGFDYTYSAYEGDLNNDGRTDLYVKSNKADLIFVGSVPIIAGPSVKDFVLRNKGDGSFVLISNLSSNQRAQAAQWPISDVSVSIRDLDFDGNYDLDLLNIRDEIPGARDQIVVSSETWGSPPATFIDKNTKFRNFHNDLIAGLLDPSYFDDNAPLKVTSWQQGEGHPPAYFGSVVTAGDFSSTATLLDVCNAAKGSAEICVLSDMDPSPCNQLVAIYDEFMNYLGQDYRNACSAYINVFIFVTEMIVTATRDYSMFDADAREATDIIEAQLPGCTIWDSNAGTTRLNAIMSGILGLAVDLTASNIFSNTLRHPRAPNDGAYSTSDPTFHHFDVHSKLCDVGQPSCNLTAANSVPDKGIVLFSYPSHYLGEYQTALDGVTNYMVYGSLNPLYVHDPLHYTWPVGDITQTLLGGTYWNNAIQNKTKPNHVFYPGRITRTVINDGHSLFVLTHGIGTNTFFCLPPSFPPGSQIVQSTGIALGAVNDAVGPMVFSTLDRQFRKAWRAQHGYAAQLAVPSSQKAGAYMSVTH